MKCHYEMLGIPRDADDSEIKKSYRKLALQWHPDKNLNDQEKAREQFQLIQQAYEVLSDAHERAWYDNHRDQILRGRNSDYEDNCLDVFQYFTVTCFKGYGDDPDGFYAVYSEVFKKIVSEDAEFMEDEEDLAEIPGFGNSESSYEEFVGPFYGYWQSYCTKKTYSWLCKYNITEIKDRRILREIEKDTKKLAQKAKRERNEEVRNLVSFVKKRDKRVQAYRKQLEEKAELNRKKQEQNRLEQIKKRNKELEEMKKSHANSSMKLDGYEEQLRLLEQEYGGSSEEYTDDDGENEEDDIDENKDEQESEAKESLPEEVEDIYVDDLYCVACDKTFKNKKALTNHQTSQKHLMNVEKIKSEMLEEEGILVEDNIPEQSSQKEECSISQENLAHVENLDGESKASKKEKKSKKSKKNSKNVGSVSSITEPEELPDLLADLSIEIDSWAEDKKSTKKGKNKKQGKKTTESITADNNSKSDEQEVFFKANEDSSSNAKDKKKIETRPAEELDLTHVCVTCKSVFQSKNKLFNHLKQTNHGVYLPKAKESSSNSGSGANSRKNKNKK